LSTVEDRSGNTLSFTYDTKTRDVEYEGCGTENYDRAVYPLRIEYGPSNRVRISFEISPEDTRADVNSNWKPKTSPQFRYRTEMLDKIVIEAKDSDSGSFETVRIYAFEYYTTSWGVNPEWLTLEQVRTVGRDDSELPTMEFTYKEAGDYSGIGDGHRKRKVLTEINNGYGGRRSATSG
jgi:hypothetical protein